MYHFSIFYQNLTTYGTYIHSYKHTHTYIQKIIVNQGIASNLLLAVGDYAKTQGVKTIHLQVLANNDAALSLYNSQGFTIYNTNPLSTFFHETLRMGRIDMLKNI